MKQTKIINKEAIHVLLIDDSEVDNFINKSVISKEECISKITVMNSGLDALGFLNTIIDQPESFPDIIFLDIRMPRMNGFEFLDHYIKFPDALKNHCKIYILSSSMDSVDSEKGKKYSVVKRHLTKPLAHHQLRELLLEE